VGAPTWARSAAGLTRVAVSAAARCSLGKLMLTFWLTWKFSVSACSARLDAWARCQQLQVIRLYIG